MEREPRVRTRMQSRQAENNDIILGEDTPIALGHVILSVSVGQLALYCTCKTFEVHCIENVCRLVSAIRSFLRVCRSCLRGLLFNVVQLEVY